jgi:hypothetical protein
MAGGAIDLGQLFQAVTQTLSSNKEALNQADGYNGNHGDNMVDIFQTITDAVGKKSGLDAGAALAYAAKVLGKKQKSGSAKIYTAGLKGAAQKFKDKQVTQDNALDLIQSLLGGGAPAAQQQPAGGDLLGSLLGGLGGGQEATQGDSGLDAGDLLAVGLAFMQAKQKGGSNSEAILNALLSAGPLGESAHRQQSGMLVGNTLMQVLGSLGR